MRKLILVRHSLARIIRATTPISGFSLGEAAAHKELGKVTEAEEPIREQEGAEKEWLPETGPVYPRGQPLVAPDEIRTPISCPVSRLENLEWKDPLGEVNLLNLKGKARISRFGITD